MPPRHYKSITIHESLYWELERLRRILQMGSIPDIIRYLVQNAEKYLKEGKAYQKED